MVLIDGLRDNAIKNSENGQHGKAQSRPNYHNNYTCTHVEKKREENITVPYSINIFSSSFLIITFIATRMASSIMFVRSVKSPHCKLADVTGSISFAKSTFLSSGKPSITYPTWPQNKDLSTIHSRGKSS